jgi:superfamily II DNA or RNA helicase
MKDVDRQKLIADLAAGKLKILTSCDLLLEGVDVPVVECGIILRPTKSLTVAIQSVGRILRPAPGKDRAIILDHAGNAIRFGLPTTPREWSLDGKRRQKRDQDDDLRIRHCTACYAVHEYAPACPYCGYGYTPKENEKYEAPAQKKGALVNLTDEDRIRNKRQVAIAKTESDLIRIGTERGYSNPRGWAYHILQSRKKRYARS